MNDDNKIQLARRAGTMTGCEVRVEAWLRGYLPEGPVEDFTPRQKRVHELATDWRECFESYGEEHGATLGCLLALVREASGEPDAHPSRTTTQAATSEYRGLRPARAVDSEGGGWHVLGWGINRGRGRHCDMLAGADHSRVDEALVCALEAVS